MEITFKRIIEFFIFFINFKLSNTLMQQNMFETRKPSKNTFNIVLLPTQRRNPCKASVCLFNKRRRY